METVVDQLSWDKFLEKSKENKNINEITDFNRLIAHSKNFFLISGYGAFKEGYFLLITKDFIPSYGLIPDDQIEELNYMIHLTKKIISSNLKKKSIVFEHGMCACIGGLDRAHLHIMSLSENTNKTSLTKAINQTLYNRKAGIKYIKYNNYKLENIHDINQLFNESKSSKDIKVYGKLLSINSLKNLSPKKWPLNTLSHITKGGHYVFFKSEYEESSFLTKHNFQTQFGREVAYNNELIIDKDFRNLCSDLIKENSYLEVWKWQNYKFEKNILKTIIFGKSALKKIYIQEKEKFKSFDIEVL